MKPLKFQHRVTRTRVNGCKLPELRQLQRPLWIRRVLVGLRPPAARAQEGQLEGSASLWWCGAFFCFRPLLPFLLPSLRYASRAAAHQPDRRLHHLQHRGLVGVLIAGQQRRHILPSARGCDILERELPPLRGPFPHRRIRRKVVRGVTQVLGQGVWIREFPTDRCSTRANAGCMLV